jgi:energy-coupling factor transport system permease protein
MLFLYQPGHSFMHRMDAVSKLIWLVSITIAVIVAVRAVENLTIFVWVVFIGLVFARLNPLLFLKRIAPLLGISLWILIMMTVLYPRGVHQLGHIGPIRITYEGLDYGLGLFFRLLSLGTSSVVFTLTTEPRRMINELIELAHLPYRWAYAVYAALRFMPMLQSEAGTILNAHAVRGAAEKRSLFDRITPIKRLTVPLMASAMRRVQLTAIAMDSRAFGAYPVRTNIEDLQPFIPGNVFAWLHVAGFIGFVFWHFVYGGGGLLIAPMPGA